MNIAPRVALNVGMRAVLRSQLGDMHPLATATLYESSPLKFLRHYHQQFEMVLVIDGAGLRHVGDSLHEYSSGDFILMGPGLPHRYESSPSRLKTSLLYISIPTFLERRCLRTQRFCS